MSDSSPDTPKKCSTTNDSKETRGYVILENTNYFKKKKTRNRTCKAKNRKEYSRQIIDFCHQFYYMVVFLLREEIKIAYGLLSLNNADRICYETALSLRRQSSNKAHLHRLDFQGSIPRTHGRGENQLHELPFVLQ